MKKIGLNIGDNTGVYLNNLLRPLEEIKKPPIYSAEQTRDDKRLQVPEKITSQTPENLYKLSRGLDILNHVSNQSAAKTRLTPSPRDTE